MPEYSLAFADKLAEAAQLVASDSLDYLDGKRTVLYLSLLSTEITLKSILEQAGKPVRHIRARSHDLSALLQDVAECTITAEVVHGTSRKRPASNVRALTIDSSYANATVGTLLEAKDKGASKYPNQVRYGSSLEHYPPELVVKMASAVITWAHEHWNDIRVV
jgi:hypothetical protein